MSLFSILFLFLSIPVFANCLVDGVVIPESKAVSLFDQGRSLSAFKVQDQDGLGTCYANTTSAQLTSVLEGHPEVSYLYAGIINGSSTEAWAQGNAQYIAKDGTDLSSSGSVCETIESLQKIGGACPKQFSLLENNQGVDRELQKNLLLGLGKYFDRLNSIKADPKKLTKLNADLSLSLEIIEAETNKLRESCLERKQQAYPSRAGFKYLMRSAIEDAKADKSACGEKRFAKLKSFLSSSSRINEEEMLIDPTPELQSRFQQFMEADAELEENLGAYLVSPKNEVPEPLMKGFLPKLELFLKHEMSTGDETGCPTSGLVKSLLHSEPLETAKTFLRRMRSDKRAQCKDELSNDETLRLITSAGEKYTCLDPTNMQQVLSAVAPLVTVGALLGKNLKAELSNLNSQHAQQLTNALMPGCQDPKKLINLEKMSCETHHTCDQGLGTKSFSRYSGVKGPGKCLDLEAAKKLTRSRVFSEIGRGGAIGLNSCVSYFLDPSAPATGFCRKKLGPGQEYPIHTMTVSGYRCAGGKIEYELLNSWGRSCPDKQRLKNEAFECSTDKNGEPTGRLWVKEDVMVDSTLSLTSLKVGK